MGVIELAENVSQSSFLDTELIKIPQYIEEKRGLMVAIILASLKRYVFTRGKMPKGAVVFKENEKLVRDISHLEDNWAMPCMITLSKMLGGLQASEDSNQAEIIAKLSKFAEDPGREPGGECLKLS